MKSFMKKAQYWASSFSTLCIFNSNDYTDDYSAFSLTIAVGEKASFKSNGSDTLEKLQIFLDQHAGEFIAGYIGYDLKNELEENLQAIVQATTKDSSQDFANSFLFVPEQLIVFKNQEVRIQSSDPKATKEAILNCSGKKDTPLFSGILRSRMSRQEYAEAFQNIQKHIQRGDIYEVNLCQEFYAEQVDISPYAVYQRLNELSPTPFSCYFRNDQHYIISASPERFLAKRGDTLLSQPIKGTMSRGRNFMEDEAQKNALRNSPKDISENIMIVDLVRNDMTQVAEPGSVKVDELLGLYSFPQVHQLISTVTCTLKEESNFATIINSTFPPGSMTGAPKIRAMEIIEATEKSQRGVYSGCVGYFSPAGDFDFNVIIRSILYNGENKYLSYQVGGAITALSNEEEEYQECLLKAEAILKCLVP